jgi:putative heme-binding domain, Pirellula/Verrucomicrobium type
MLIRNIYFARFLTLLVVFGTGVHVPSSVAQEHRASRANSKAAGQSTFNSACAGCHGLDGRGSDKAVNITGSEKVRHLSDAQLAGIVADGVPGTGMPGFRNLSDRQIDAVVGYIRLLQGKSETRTLPGDPTHGKAIFFGKGECFTCHAVSGQGGFLGPDLSGYGSSVSAPAIRDEIVKPQRKPVEGYRRAVLTTANGDHLEGVIRNEDNFSVQFQTRDGGFHFFQKSKLQKVEYLDASLMPTNYGSRLSTVELNDLVSFLMIAAPDAGKRGTSHTKEEPAE